MSAVHYTLVNLCSSPMRQGLQCAHFMDEETTASQQGSGKIRAEHEYRKQEQALQ